MRDIVSPSSVRKVRDFNPLACMVQDKQGLTTMVEVDYRLLDCPGVVVDDDGNIVVADVRNKCIQKFTSEGKFIKTVGEEGNGCLEFSFPTGLNLQIS